MAHARRVRRHGNFAVTVLTSDSQLPVGDAALIGAQPSKKHQRNMRRRCACGCAIPSAKASPASARSTGGALQYRQRFLQRHKRSPEALMMSSKSRALDPTVAFAFAKRQPRAPVQAVAAAGAGGARKKKQQQGGKMRSRR